MPRPRSKSREELIARAMPLFWRQGYHATSMDALVKATGVARGGIYADFEGKDGLFRACLEAYRKMVAGPAIELLQAEGAGVEAIKAYFDFFIAKHERNGMPGPGCFVANAMTEMAPHDPEIAEIVSAHNKALQKAFTQCLKNAQGESAKLSNKELKDLAEFLVTSSQGLWSYARSTRDIGSLRNFSDTLVGLLKARMS